jgi:hypothetical protein
MENRKPAGAYLELGACHAEVLQFAVAELERREEQRSRLGSPNGGHEEERLCQLLEAAAKASSAGLGTALDAIELLRSPLSTSQRISATDLDEQRVVLVARWHRVADRLAMERTSLE